MRLAAALLLAATAASAKVTSGVVVQAMAKMAPSSDGPSFREGRLVMTDKKGEQLELKITLKTAVTLDGKAAKFHKAAAPGVAVFRVQYDDKNVASVLALKSAAGSPKAANVAQSYRGEIANTDILKNMITVRTGRQNVRDFVVAEGTTIKRAPAPDKNPEPVGLEALQVGDGIELYSADGKTAVTITASPAK